MLKTEAGHVRAKEELLGELETNHSELAKSYHELNTSKNLLSVICHDMANPLTVCLAISERAMMIMNDLLNSVRTMHADSSGKVELNW